MIQQGLKRVGDFNVFNIIQLCKYKAVHILVNFYKINSTGNLMIAVHKQFGSKEDFRKPAVVNCKLLVTPFKPNLPSMNPKQMTPP